MANFHQWLSRSEASCGDFYLYARLGRIPSASTVNKFGEAPDCDSGVATDIWDGADGSTSTDEWVAPTAARIHALASGSANDAAAGTGMRTVEVYGLQTWDSEETSETVTLNGLTGVNTTNSYVIIHRMKGLTFGSGNTNAGIITATAATDSTVTAAIQAGEGQTLMAIYGVPSTQDILVKHVDASIDAGSVANVTMRLLVREDADTSGTSFVTKDKTVIAAAAPWDRAYDIPKKYSGPCVVKLQATSDTNNVTTTGGFDAVLIPQL